MSALTGRDGALARVAASKGDENRGLVGRCGLLSAAKGNSIDFLKLARRSR
jgi:hypothetical protein